MSTLGSREDRPSILRSFTFSYGMFKIDDTFIEKWQFVFVVLGPLTVVYGECGNRLTAAYWCPFSGILILFVMPNSPKTAWFLSPEKRGLALDRVRENMSGTAVPKWQHYQVVEALKDIRLYLIGLTTFAASVPTGGITSFGAVIVKGFGYEVKTTTLIGVSQSRDMATYTSRCLQASRSSRRLSLVWCSLHF